MEGTQITPLIPPGGAFDPLRGLAPGRPPLINTPKPVPLHYDTDTPPRLQPPKDGQKYPYPGLGQSKENERETRLKRAYNLNEKGNEVVNVPVTEPVFVRPKKVEKTGAYLYNCLRSWLCRALRPLRYQRQRHGLLTMERKSHSESNSSIRRRTKRLICRINSVMHAPYSFH